MAHGLRRTGSEPGPELLGSHVSSQQRCRHREALACERSTAQSHALQLHTQGLSPRQALVKKALLDLCERSRDHAPVTASQTSGAAVLIANGPATVTEPACCPVQAMLAPLQGKGSVTLS